MAREYKPRPVPGKVSKAVQGKADYAWAVVLGIKNDLIGAVRFTWDGLTVTLESQPTVDEDGDGMVEVVIKSVVDSAGNAVPFPGIMRWSAPRYEVWDGTYWQEDVEIVDDADIEAAVAEERPVKTKTAKVDHKRMIENPRKALNEQIVETIHLYGQSLSAGEQ